MIFFGEAWDIEYPNQSRHSRDFVWMSGGGHEGQPDPERPSESACLVSEPPRYAPSAGMPFAKKVIAGVVPVALFGTRARAVYRVRGRRRYIFPNWAVEHEVRASFSSLELRRLVRIIFLLFIKRKF